MPQKNLKSDVKNCIKYNYVRENRNSFLTSYDFLTNPAYKKMPRMCILMYSIMRDRMELSVRNGEKWTNENGNVFIYYSQEELAELLQISKKTVYNYFKELKKYDLIVVENCGFAKPNRIYFKPVQPAPNLEKYKKMPSYKKSKTLDQPKHKKTKPQNTTTLKNKPSRKSVSAYAMKLNQCVVSPQEFYNTMENNGWCDSNGNPVKSWQGFYRQWNENRIVEQSSNEYKTYNPDILAPPRYNEEIHKNYPNYLDSVAPIDPERAALCAGS